MRVAMLSDDPYLSAALHPLLALERMAFTTCQTVEHLCEASRHCDDIGLVLLDCSSGSAQALLRCIQAIPLIHVPACLIHPRESTAREVAASIGVPLRWLSADLPLRGLRDLLHLQEAGLSSRSPTGGMPFSSREREVLALSAAGCSDAAIGSLLALSPGSVKSYGARGRQKALIHTSQPISQPRRKRT